MIRWLLIFIVSTSFQARAQELFGTGGGGSDNQDEECRDLKPGESRSVSEDSDNSLTGVSRHYTVQRDKEKSNVYDINFNMYFVDKSSKGQGISNRDEYNTETLKKVNSCFEKFNDKLRDHLGRKLRLKATYNDKDSKVRPQMVEIGSTDRAHQFDWGNPSACETVIHEALHHAGLIDSYQEKEMKHPFGGKMFDCRHSSNQENVMGDHLKALSSKTKVTVCVCRGGACMNSPSSVSKGENKCPAEYDQVMSQDYATSQVPTLAREYGKSPGVMVITADPKDNEKPAVTKNQVDTIQKPRCSRSLYIACAKNAYRSSGKEGCVDSPPGCSSGDF